MRAARRVKALLVVEKTRKCPFTVVNKWCPLLSIWLVSFVSCCLSTLYLSWTDEEEQDFQPQPTSLQFKVVGGQLRA